MAHPSHRAAWVRACCWPRFPWVGWAAQSLKWLPGVAKRFILPFFQGRPTLILLGEIFTNSQGFCSHSFFLEGTAAEGR